MTMINDKHPLEDAQPHEHINTRGEELAATFGRFAGEDLLPDYDSNDADEKGSVESDEIERIKRQHMENERPQGTAGVGRAVFLLIKAFVGTGILFLPKAFYNGGMWFSIALMMIVAILSLFSYLLLVDSRKYTKGGGSFGDIAGTLYGPKMRFIVQSSIALSQMGFVCAYLIFIAENVRAFVLQVTNCRVNISEGTYIVLQALIFIPFAMIRRIEKLGFTSLISEAFILFGIMYIYYYDISIIAARGIHSTVKAFNTQDFALFIGTAVYSFEGIGLVIPITEAMREPEKFPRVLWITLIIVTFLFVSVGAIGYAAFGNEVKTMAVENLPQGTALVESIQILYALAIVFSVPLQLFPAITILEKGSFGASRSGRVSMKWKWSKNLFRAMLVLICVVVSWVGSNDLDKFVSLIGSFACIPLCFIYPPMFHLRSVASTMRAKILDWALIVFGFVVMFYATYITVISWAAGGGAPHDVCIPH